MKIVEERDPQLHSRYATALDNTLLAEVGAETFYDSFAAENTPENMAAYLAKSFSPEKQACEQAEPASRFLIVEEKSLVVGYVRLKFGPAPSAVTSRKPMEIARFYVRKPWIGKGVGAWMMQTCLREAEREGCDVIWLDVWERNPRAIAFYRKWGFVDVGVQTFQLGDDSQRDLVMARATSLNAV